MSLMEKEAAARGSCRNSRHSASEDAAAAACSWTREIQALQRTDDIRTLECLGSGSIWPAIRAGLQAQDYLKRAVFIHFMSCTARPLLWR